MYLFCLVQQAEEDLQAKYKEMEKELKLYKEKEAALAAPPVLSAPPKVVPSAPPQVVAPPKVVSPAPSIPPAGLLQENSLASSALPGESLGKAKKFVEETFVNVTGKDQQSIRRRLISRSFRDQSYAIEGGSVVKYALTSTGEFGNEIVDQLAKYWDGKEAKKTCDIDQLVRDQRKRENVVVDGRPMRQTNAPAVDQSEGPFAEPLSLAAAPAPSIALTPGSNCKTKSIQITNAKALCGCATCQNQGRNASDLI